MTSTFSSGQKRKRSFSEPLSMAQNRRITESDHVDQIERITPAARGRRRSMEPPDSKKKPRLTPASSSNGSITRRWHRSESPWTHHYQTEIPLSCSSINVITAESDKSEHNQMNDIRLDIWPKAGTADHQKGMGNMKREGGGYSEHIHFEPKAGTRNVPRIRELKKVTADLHHANPSSDSKSIEAVSASLPTLKRTGRKTNLSFYLVISSAIVVLLLLFMPTLVKNLSESFHNVRAANLSYISQFTEKCAASFVALADGDSGDILGKLSHKVFFNAGKNISESKLCVPEQHENLIPVQLDTINEIVTDDGVNSLPIQTVSVLSSDVEVEDTTNRNIEAESNLSDNLSSSELNKLLADENNGVSKLESVGYSEDAFILPLVLETDQTDASVTSDDIPNIPSIDGLTVGIDKSSHQSDSAPVTPTASLTSDSSTPSLITIRDIDSNTDTNITDELVSTTDDRIDSNAHDDTSPIRSEGSIDRGEVEPLHRLNPVKAHSKGKETLQDTDGHHQYGVDYAVWPRGGRVAHPGVAVLASGAAVTLTSPPHVLSLGTLKRIQHRLHLDGIADEGVIISTEPTSRSPGGYIEGNTPVHDLASNCFIFSGSIGSATVIMHSLVDVSAVQIVSYNAPYSSDIDTVDVGEDLGSSAPKSFTLTGWSSDPTQTVSSKLTGYDLGTYEYVRPMEGVNEVQTFVLPERERQREGMSMSAYKAVTVSVLSNHGADYTSLCRVKILGTLLPSL